MTSSLSEKRTSDASPGNSTENMPSSRMRLAISCVYWEPAIVRSHGGVGIGHSNDDPVRSLP